MQAEANGIRYFRGQLPPGLSPKTYDSGRGTGATTAEVNFRTIRIPVDISEIFMTKVRELIDSLKVKHSAEDAVVMEYHLTCTLEPKPVFEQRLKREEEQWTELVLLRAEKSEAKALTSTKTPNWHK